MSYDLAKFKHGLEELRITLTDHQIEQFLQYYETVSYTHLTLPTT